MVRTAIILAGGLGTRLRKVAPKVPKPMAPINNRPFLEYQMDYWINQGITQFILSVGYLKDVIINHFSNSYKGISIEYVEESSPLGTGGGLLFAAKNLHETFVVLNGDTFFEVNINSLYKFHLKRSSNWTFALFRSDEIDRYMFMDIDQKGEIVSLKSNNNVLNGLANGGVYLIEPEALRVFDYSIGDKVSLENELLPSYIAKGNALYGQECIGKFIDIGIPQDYYRSISILSD